MTGVSDASHSPPVQTQVKSYQPIIPKHQQAQQKTMQNIGKEVLMNKTKEAKPPPLAKRASLEAGKPLKEPVQIIKTANQTPTAAPPVIADHRQEAVLKRTEKMVANTNQPRTPEFRGELNQRVAARPAAPQQARSPQAALNRQNQVAESRPTGPASIFSSTKLGDFLSAPISGLKTLLGLLQKSKPITERVNSDTNIIFRGSATDSKLVDKFEKEFSSKKEVDVEEFTRKNIPHTGERDIYRTFGSIVKAQIKALPDAQKENLTLMKGLLAPIAQSDGLDKGEKIMIIRNNLSKFSPESLEHFKNLVLVLKEAHEKEWNSQATGVPKERTFINMINALPSVTGLFAFDANAKHDTSPTASMQAALAEVGEAGNVADFLQFFGDNHEAIFK